MIKLAWLVISCACIDISARNKPVRSHISRHRSAAFVSISSLHIRHTCVAFARVEGSKCRNIRESTSCGRLGTSFDNVCSMGLVTVTKGDALIAISVDVNNIACVFRTLN